jgi:RNA-directed DNA polymerase
MAYIPQADRRKYIPKPGSTKQRSLGIPCFEDNLVQAGLVRIMESVYEQDFNEDSYGFRPARSCHDALKTLSLTMEHKPVNHIVEADIKGFFDNVNQEWLLKFLAHRIGDNTQIFLQNMQFIIICELFYYPWFFAGTYSSSRLCSGWCNRIDHRWV